MKSALTPRLALVVMLSAALPAMAQEKQDAGLAKKSQNPVGDLISLPFQPNLNFGVGPDDDTQVINLIQPVMPIGLTENWNLINRPIVPLPVHQPVPGDDDETGIGDIQYQAFLTPAKPGKVIWGIGPNFSFPSASDDVLGTDKWSAGPAVVVLATPGPWVVGTLVNHLWSFAGDDDRDDVSQTSLQYFINYNIPKSGGWYLSSTPVNTYNWEAKSGERFTIPVGGGFGRVFHIGKQAINAKVQAFGYPEAPDGGPDWTLQLQLTFLFPK